MEHTAIFQKLWDDYRLINPSVDKIHHLLNERGEHIINDHIALRTYDVAGINIEALAETFLAAGYVEKGSYNFEEKKLNATHYEHSSDNLAPKVFISELKTKEFSPLVQETAHWVATQVKKADLKKGELLFSKRVWDPINFTSYEALRQESEYAAWLYVFGFRANHFTVFVNHLKSIASLEEMNAFLKEKGFPLNVSGGEIKGTKEQLLKQSSTLADKTVIEFQDGAKEIPCCYYEFAERFEERPGQLFTGFIAKSADKIFESTDKN
jgi:hypothetical protein